MRLTQLDATAIVIALALYVALVHEQFLQRRERLRSMRSARVVAAPFVIVLAAVLTANWIPAPVIVGVAIWSLRKPTVPKSSP